MKPLPKLTRKQKAFVKYALEHPKESFTEAAVQSYNVINRHSAKVIAAENLTKPVIQTLLLEADQDSQMTIKEMMQQRQDKRLAFDAARDIQDRLHGKATIRQEVKSQTVSVNINLTSEE
jgi:phage terminase small subunit